MVCICSTVTFIKRDQELLRLASMAIAVTVTLPIPCRTLRRISSRVRNIFITLVPILCMASFPQLAAVAELPCRPYQIL